MFTLLRKVTVALRNTTPRRFFLSEAYKCEEAWGQRFESPLLKQINPNSMFYELQNKFENEGVVSAVDIDLFVNKITDPEQGEEILQLIQQLRLTAETSSTLDSTHHAVIRYLLKNDYKEDLLEILHNRLDYGIFPDHYCFNVLMDTYIEQKDFVSASKVASLLMLQEDSDHPLSNAFCIYSCHKYLENPEPWQIEIEKIEEPEEEVKVRVRYLANPYFDDHFDLIESSDLVGKTLVFQGKRLDNALGRSLHLRGLMLYKKYQVAEKLIDDWLKKDTKDIVYSEILDIIQKDNINITGDAVTDEYKKILEQLNSLRKCELHPGSINEAIETQLRSAIDQYSEEDITKQIQVIAAIYKTHHHFTIQFIFFSLVISGFQGLGREKNVSARRTKATH